MALTKAVEAVQDWTAVAQNAVGESGTLDCAGHYASELHIQAFLDTVTTSTGIRFIIQVSSNTADDEDWEDLTEFVALLGTAVTDAIENAPLGAGETTITLTGHAYTALAKWLAIKDSTLVNSELVFEVSQTANEVVVLDGVTNAHVATTPMYNIAMVKVIVLPFGTIRARVIVDNTYDPDGSSMNYKIRATKVTAI